MLSVDSIIFSGDHTTKLASEAEPGDPGAGFMFGTKERRRKEMPAKGEFNTYLHASNPI